MRTPTSALQPLLLLSIAANVVRSQPSFTLRSTPAPGDGSTIRVNCGSSNPYTDPYGQVWQPDAYSLGGDTYGTGDVVLNTELDALFATERYFPWWDTNPYRYSFPISNGDYALNLMFAEIFYSSPGNRIFQVWVEGILMVDDLDIVGQVGFKTALTLTFFPSVTDGVLDIEFVGLVENPKISGIEIMPFSEYQPPTMAPSISMQPSAQPTISAQPTSSPAPTAVPVFENIYINCGGTEYVDNAGVITWQADQYFTGGNVYVDGSNDIANTEDDQLYQSERNGAQPFSYEIPVPTGNYEIVLHFAEVFWTEADKRVFDVMVEDEVFESIDIFALGGNQRLVAFTLETAQIVSDGFLSITITAVDGKDQGKLSGIEVKLVGPHYAHAVAGGPYKVVDVDGDGYGDVPVDAFQSHTHYAGAALTSFSWKKGSTVLATTRAATLELAVGTHTIAVTVIDDQGNESTEATTAEVLPFGYPAVLSVSPDSGPTAGGESVTITGSGFTASAAETIVRFGLTELTGSDIEIVDQFTINLLSPLTLVGAPVQVTVETPLAESNAGTYTYVAGVPINFTSAILSEFDSPTVVKFGPDRNLYVGTIDGKLGRITLNEDYTEVVDIVVSLIAQYRCVLGITFDPMDVYGELSAVYVSTSFFFHGGTTSSSGDSINGDVRKVTGANLDVQVDIITGLPISDHDHGVNGLEFGDHGELYMQIGSNTNGGLPGQLSGSQLQRENYYSAATLFAHVSDPLFNGNIEYDAADDGTPLPGSGVKVFASGSRNPYGIVLHSNGKLYGTDNGSNLGYGDMKTGCGPTDFIPDVETEDKINLLVKDGYYGHPNPKRAAVDGDPRQCVWRSPYDESDADFTAPLLRVPASTDGIIEWQSDHFDKQLRGNLIASKYQDGLLRVILTPDGEEVIPESDPALPLVGDNGLDVAQAPDGTLVDARVGDSVLYFHKPVEPPTSDMIVKAVFPTRGPQAGGSTLDIYGVNLDKSSSPTVMVGDSYCIVTSVSSIKIECTIPLGFPGTVDIVVTAGLETSTFENGYRYITGIPLPTPAPTSAPTTQAPVGAPVTPAPTLSPTAAPVQTGITVDAGAATDTFVSSSGGNVRTDFTGDPIANTAGYSETIFQTGRSADGEFTYTIGGFDSAVSALITLGFAELWTGACIAGVRAQNVVVNGQTFLTNFDIGGTAGDCFTATFQQGVFNSNASGDFVIKFVGVTQNPLVNLIDITTDVPPDAPTFAPVAAPSPGKWEIVDAEAPIVQRHEACMVMVGRKAIMVGGRETQEVDIYDPTSRTWSKGAEAPELLHHMQCVAAQGKLWIMAAWTGIYPREENASSAYVYDPEDGTTGSWTPLPALPEARRRGGAATMVNLSETKIYVSHGNSGGHEVADDTVDAVSLPYLDVYDITSNTWSALSSSAPNPRDHTGGFMKDNKLYVTGGRNGGELGWPEVAATDVYDLSTGEWSTAAAIPNPRSGANYGVTCDGNLMIAGGERPGIWNTVSVFDGNSWIEIDSLNEGRHGVGLAFDCICNQIHIASGAGGAGGAPLLSSVETYFPSGADPGVAACPA